MPDSSLIADLLAPIRGQVDFVYAYDAVGQRWVVYNAAVPYAQELERVEAGQGVWVHALADVTWQVACKGQVTSTISLAPGWNLVGYPFAVGQDIAAATAGLGAHLQAVYAYDATAAAQPWRIYVPGGPAMTLASLQPGEGYWMQVDEACSWSLQTP